MRVDYSRYFAINSWRYDDLQISFLQQQDEFIRVITFVGDEVIGKQILDERFGLRDVIAVAAG